MKIIVFSDSHTDIDTMAAAAKKETPDIIMHLGDCRADGRGLSSLFPGIPAYLLRGNTDSDGENEIFLEISGKNLFVTHGHIYNVEGGLAELSGRAAFLGADIAVFGHTHRPRAEYADGIWLLNPGRIGRRSSRIIHATYGIIDISGGRVRVEIAEA